MKRFMISCAVLLLLVLASAGCGASSAQGPTAWLDEPLDGAELPLEPTEIMAHASDADGVASIEFLVNDVPLARAPADGGVLSEATVGWDPHDPGVYTVAARATDSQGHVGADSIAVVTVGRVEGPPAPSPTLRPPEEIVTQATPSPRTPSSPAPTSTPREPTPRPTLSAPSPTPPFPTATRVPPTATPQPPARRAEIAYFEADPSTIDVGGCTTLRWGVEYATAVYLDGQGVVGYDERQVCPPSTTSYTLFATSGGGDSQESVTVTVTEAFSADLAITDLRAAGPSLEVLGDLTNHGPRTISDVTVQLHCEWEQTDPIEGTTVDSGDLSMPILVSSLSPGQTQEFNTDISVHPGQYAVDFSCSVQVPFNDPNLGNNYYSEQGW